jgi:hypothetical protein
MMEIDEGNLDTLILVRLLAAPARKSLSRSDVLRAVLLILRGSMDAAAAKEAALSSLERLERKGLREPGRMKPTPDGERQALAALGVERTAVPRSWREAKGLFLPLALGIPGGRESRARVRDADALRAEVLRRQLGLQGTAKLTFAAALNQWAARELGLDGKPFTLARIRAHVLGRAIGLDSARTSDQVAAVAVAKFANARGSSGTELRDALVRGWLRGGGAADDAAMTKPTESSSSPAAPPLDQFAGVVRALAHAETSARFGRDKVFIASLWHRARMIPEFQSLDEGAFKALLVDAHRAGLLHLSRADLTSAMSPTMVRDSEVSYLNAVFHFVNDEVSP